MSLSASAPWRLSLQRLRLGREETLLLAPDGRAQAIWTSGSTVILWHEGRLAAADRSAVSTAATAARLLDLPELPAAPAGDPSIATEPDALLVESKCGARSGWTYYQRADAAPTAVSSLVGSLDARLRRLPEPSAAAALIATDLAREPLADRLWRLTHDAKVPAHSEAALVRAMGIRFTPWSASIVSSLPRGREATGSPGWAYPLTEKEVQAWTKQGLTPQSPLHVTVGKRDYRIQLYRVRLSSAS